MLVGTEAGLFRYMKAGSSWNAVDSALLQMDVSGFADGITGIIAGTLGNGIFQSSDTGKTWTPTDTGLTDGNVYNLASQGKEVFACTPTSGFLSTDGGLHWTGMPPWEARYPPYGALYRPVYSPPYLEIACRRLLGGTRSDGVFLSTDDGHSWTAVNNGFPPPIPLYEVGYPSIFSLAFAGTSLIAGTDEGLFFSTDVGGQWTASDSGWVPGGVGCFASRGVDVFAGSPNGVFHSSNGGKAWRAVNAGLINPGITALAVSGTDLFAAVFEDGVWMRPLAEMIASAQDELSATQATFRLEQNYPNPFNPTTTIRYAIPRRGSVRITVFNVLGQEVGRLVDGVQDAGYHDVRFDGTRLASGIYFYRILAGGFSQTKRFVLVR